MWWVEDSAGSGQGAEAKQSPGRETVARVAVLLWTARGLEQEESWDRISFHRSNS